MLAIKGWEGVILLKGTDLMILTQINGLDILIVRRLRKTLVTFFEAAWKICERIKHGRVSWYPEVIREVRSHHYFLIIEHLIANLMQTFGGLVIWKRCFSFIILYAIEAWSLYSFLNSNHSLYAVLGDRIFMANGWKADFLVRLLVWEASHFLAQAVWMMHYTRLWLSRVHEILYHCLMRQFERHVITRIIIPVI